MAPDPRSPAEMTGCSTRSREAVATIPRRRATWRSRCWRRCASFRVTSGRRWFWSTCSAIRSPTPRRCWAWPRGRSRAAARVAGPGCCPAWRTCARAAGPAGPAGTDSPPDPSYQRTRGVRRPGEARAGAGACPVRRGCRRCQAGGEDRGPPVALRSLRARARRSRGRVRCPRARAGAPGPRGGQRPHPDGAGRRGAHEGAAGRGRRHPGGRLCRAFQPAPGTASAPGTARPARHAGKTARRAGGRAANRVPPVVLRGVAAVAAALAVAGGGYLLAGALRGAGPPAPAAAPGSGPRESGRPAGAVPRPATGSQSALGGIASTPLLPGDAEITRANLARQAKLALARAAASQHLPANPVPPRPGVSGGPRESLARLRSCLSAVSGGQQALVAETVRYGGRPAILVVLRRSASATSLEALLIGPACSPGRPDVLLRATVPAS